MPHRALGRHQASQPVLMTFHASIDTLRTPRVFTAIRLAVLGTNGAAPEAFRIVHFSVTPTRVHLIAEARDARALSSGARSIAIRIARYVNDTLDRDGPLWADRWRRRTLKTPADVRAALVFVLAQFRRDAPRGRPGIDPYSSAAWFDGFNGWNPSDTSEPPFAERGAGVAALRARGRSRKAGAGARRAAGAEPAPGAGDCPVLPPRSTLLAVAWRKLGLVGLAEAPDGATKMKATKRAGYTTQARLGVSRQ